MRRTILMMSDLQSGAEEMEIVDAVTYDKLVAERDALLGRFANPEGDLFSDAMDRAASAHHSVRHGAMRNAERVGEHIDPEIMARRAMAAGITAYLQELGFTVDGVGKHE